MLVSVIDADRQMPVRFQETKTTVNLCAQLLAKLQVLADMNVLAIDGRDLRASSMTIGQLETKSRQLRLSYDQAQNALGDYC